MAAAVGRGCPAAVRPSSSSHNRDELNIPTNDTTCAQYTVHRAGRPGVCDHTRLYLEIEHFVSMGRPLLVRSAATRHHYTAPAPLPQCNAGMASLIWLVSCLERSVGIVCVVGYCAAGLVRCVSRSPHEYGDSVTAARTDGLVAGSPRPAAASPACRESRRLFLETFSNYC